MIPVPIHVPGIRDPWIHVPWNPGSWRCGRAVRTARPCAAQGASRRPARRRGCRVCDGGHMAVHQATEAFALITGITPNAERMSRHFRRLVG